MQGFNMGRYVPPDLEGTVSFNQASGKGHALGSRARKLKTEGVLTVRFECPFAIWCTHCQPEQIIGQGVRFNAEKKKVGHYYSTPVWSFRFKHTVCGGWLEVRTDPQHAEYLVVAGGRRRDTGADKVLDGEIAITTGVTDADKDRLERDGGFGALEKTVADKTAFGSQQQRLHDLWRTSERQWADPYEMSRRLRADFRVGRRKRQADEKTGAALQDKFGLAVDLLAEEPDDAQRALFVDFGVQKEASSAAKPIFHHADADLRGLPSRSRSRPSAPADPKGRLQSQLITHTRLTTDPFLRPDDTWRSRAKRKRTEEDDHDADGDDQKVARRDTAPTALVSYDSDSS